MKLAENPKRLIIQTGDKRVNAELQCDPELLSLERNQI